MFDLVNSTLPVQKLLKKEENWNLWNLTVKHNMEKLDKHRRVVRKARYSSTKELFLEYMEENSRLVPSAKQTSELDIQIDWISALPNLDTVMEKNVWIPTLGGRFLITGMDCLRQGSHNNFKVVVPGRNPGFLIVVTARESSSLWICPGSHVFVHFPVVMRKKLVSTLQMEEVLFHRYQYLSVTCICSTAA